MVLAAPGTATAQVPAGDSVTGELSAGSEQALRFARIDAHSGPSGESPTGTASWHVGGGLGPSWRVTVTCLSVSGNTAVIGFQGSVSFLGFLSPSTGLIRVMDGGGPDSGLDSFEFAETGLPVPSPTTCSSYPGTFPVSGDPGVNLTGNFIVIDSQPELPRSMDECKNGNWQSFGVFKNQGDCVSFVATGGKNRPAGSP